MIVGLYTRVSTQEQAQEGYSLDEQESRLRKYCEALNWTIFKVYRDGGFSGASTDRPALRSMIHDIEDSRIQKVVVYKLDRLSRSQYDTLYLIERVFLSHGVDFVSMTENFDTATPFGRAMIGILSVFAQLEREQIKERMALGKEARSKEGLFHGGDAPRGYTYSPDAGLQIEPTEAGHVRAAFQMFCERQSSYSICHELENMSGRPWNWSALHYVLANRLYLGEIRHKGEWRKGSHEPIIDQKTFDKAQAILAERSKRHRENHRDGRVKSLLGGLLVCGECGKRYYSFREQTNRKQKSYADYTQIYECAERKEHHTCQNRIWKASELEQAVLDEVRKLKLALPERRQEPPKDYTAEIKKIDAQLERLMDLYSVGGISLESVQLRVNTLNERRAALEEKQYLSAQNGKTDYREAKRLIQSFDDIIHHATQEELREVLRTLIDRIEIHGEDLEIYWKL